MRILCLFILAIGFSRCSDPENNKAVTKAPENKTEEAVPDEATDLELLYPQFISFLQKQDTSFSVQYFEGGVLTGAEIPDQPIDRETLQPFLPYLKYNADSTQAIDLLSYNYIIQRENGKVEFEEVGPDVEISLLHFKKNIKTRLLFLGTMGSVLDAHWVNETTIVMGGVMSQKPDSIQPAIWKFNLQTGSRELFVYAGMISGNADSYPSWWKAPL